MAQRTYEDAIDALNTLQTNFKVLEERRQARITVDKTANLHAKSYFVRLGHSMNDLDRLNIVHVAGTKGKGTTCAYVNSILSHYQKSHGRPRKIGLFTSPHLVSVRERIRINSEPISEQIFAQYFFEVWDRLEATAKDSDTDSDEKPPYFRFLTLMSFHVFLREGVDVAIYEVGVGGEYDSTNIIEKPAVTGISALGIDHVFTLGDTIDKIAWHKAGIFKPGVPAFTVTQPEEAMKVVEQRAKEKGVNLNVVGLDPALEGVKIRPDADFQRSNASLAIALTKTALEKIDPTFSTSDGTLPQEFIDGLEQVVWRGRCEIKVDGNIRWYLDGAHTSDSLKVAAQWFSRQSSEKPGPRVFIFNQQGRSEAVELLEGFYKALEAEKIVKFDYVIFCTNVTYAKKGYKRDFVNKTYDQEAIAALTVQKQFAEKWSYLDPSANVVVTHSIEEALDHVKNLAIDETEVQAFITGSLHLIGGALGLLEDARVL